MRSDIAADPHRQKCGSRLVEFVQLHTGCAGFSCRSKAVIFTAFYPVMSRARLSINVSAMRSVVHSAWNVAFRFKMFLSP
jgi:hypothetical protein